jgi:3'(2'), 5'-bisphosphate nucleotidase
MTADWDRELAVARRLTLDAARLAERYFGQPVAVERKPGGEPVTVADKEANALIVAALAAEFPADAILAEETPDDLARRLATPRVWMVDPIDGTRDFIRGRSGFAVMIGLCVVGQPVVGAVYQPIGRRLYFAARGGGAWMAVEDAAPAPIHASAVDSLAEIRLVASRSNREPIIDAVRTRLGISDEQNVGSVGLKLGLIARGDRDLYVNPSSHSSAWDTCAPEIILVEAGGRLSDLTGAPLRYHEPEVRHLRGLVASNGRLHERVLAELRGLFPS